MGGDGLVDRQGGGNRRDACTVVRTGSGACIVAATRGGLVVSTRSVVCAAVRAGHATG